MSDHWDSSEFDGHHDLSALEWATPRAEGATSDLDALAIDEPPDGDENTAGDDISFTVTNASGDVAVTTHLNGEVERVDLASGVSRWSESELEREILAVAAVAGIKARATMNQFVSGLMLVQGQDRDSVRNVVEHQMRLPTPEQARRAEASLATQHLHHDL